MDLSIILVSWNVKDLLRSNLKSIFENTKGISFEVFVVDNASSDGSAEMVRSDFLQVSLIANTENYGFAMANNQAIRLSVGRYVLLLNPDMRVFEETLKTMVEWMDSHPEAGVAGCHLLDEKGETVPHVRRFPKIFDQLAIICKIPHIYPKVTDLYLMRSFDYSKQSSVDSIRGSFFMIRRSVIETVGVLDERYFIWFEEVDYCKRVKREGWKVMYTPSVRCLDYVGKSFCQVMGYTKQKMFTESMVKYFDKWHPGVPSILIRCIRPIGLIIAWCYDRLKSFFRIKFL